MHEENKSDISEYVKTCSLERYRTIKEAFRLEAKGNEALWEDIELARRQFRTPALQKAADQLGGEVDNHRHVIVGRREHDDLTLLDASELTKIVRDWVIKRQENFLEQEVIICSNRSMTKIYDPTKFINKCINQGLVSSFIAEYITGPRINIDSFFGVGKTLSGIFSYELIVPTKTENLYMVTVDHNPDLDVSFIKRWTDRKGQKASITSLGVEDVVRNSIVKKGNIFNKFIPYGHTLEPYEVKDEVQTQMDEITIFENSLSSSIATIAGKYDPTYEGTYITSSGKNTVNGWFPDTQVKELLHDIRFSKNPIRTRYGDDNIETYVRLQIAYKIIENLIEKHGASHEYTFEFMKSCLDWAGEHKEIQKDLDINVKKDLSRVLL